RLRDEFAASHERRQLGRERTFARVETMAVTGRIRADGKRTKPTRCGRSHDCLPKGGSRHISAIRQLRPMNVEVACCATAFSLITPCDNVTLLCDWQGGARAAWKLPTAATAPDSIRDTRCRVPSRSRSPDTSCWDLVTSTIRL